MTKETRALIEAAEAVLSEMDMGFWPDSIERFRAAISSAKAAEEGVETDWRVECERGKWNETFLPDDLKDARLVYLEAVRDYPNAKKISLIRRDTYTTVIEVREKEGL